MQKINLIAQSVLELSHRENADDDNNDNDDDNDDDDTHPGWIIVRVGRYSVADKNNIIIIIDILLTESAAQLTNYTGRLHSFIQHRNILHCKTVWVPITEKIDVNT